MASSCRAARTDWSDSYRRWGQSLTYPDSEWRPDDFGTEATPEDKALLERFRPRISIAPGGLSPIDFYGDDLPQCVLALEGRGVVQRTVTRKNLKRVERSYGYSLGFEGEHRPFEDRERPATLYGRVFRERMRSIGGSPERAYTVLKYNAVFTASGLPAKISFTRAFFAWVAGTLASGTPSTFTARSRFF